MTSESAAQRMRTAWLADVLTRIAEHPARKLDELLPWKWLPERRSITT